MIDLDTGVSLNTITALAQVAMQEYPYLQGQIRSGVILVALGMVEPAAVGHWAVVSASRPTCRDVSLTGTPPRWNCGCYQSNVGGVVEFLGGHGHICKHIAAVALYRQMARPLPKIGRVYEAVERLCSLPPDVLFIDDGHAKRIKWPGCRSVNIIYNDGDYRLAIGRKRSRMIASFVGGQMLVYDDIERVYNHFLTAHCK